MQKVNNIRNYLIKKSEFKDWESVFINPAPINIETLKTGVIVSKISGMINLNNVNAVKLKDGIANIPVLAHILRHEKYGDYLIDTGFDSSSKNKRLLKRQEKDLMKILLKRIIWKSVLVMMNI